MVWLDQANQYFLEQLRRQIANIRLGAAELRVLEYLYDGLGLVAVVLGVREGGRCGRVRHYSGFALLGDADDMEVW